MKSIEEITGSGTGRLWIADFDGTIAIDGIMLPENADIIRKILESGAEYVSASARSVPDQIRRFIKAGLGEFIDKKIHFSSHNGNFAGYEQLAIINNVMTKNVLSQVLGDKPEEKDLVMFDNGRAYSFNPNTPILEWYSKQVIGIDIKKVNQIPENIYIIESVIKNEFDRIEILSQDINNIEFKPPFSNNMNELSWQQISASGDKEDLIKAYADIMGITDHKGIITVGDGDNDKKLINNPQVRGIMMGNGKMKLENSYKTLPIDKGGFAHIYKTLKKN